MTPPPPSSRPHRHPGPTVIPANAGIPAPHLATSPRGSRVKPGMTTTPGPGMAVGSRPAQRLSGTFSSLCAISSMETSRKVSTLALFTNRAGRYMSQTQASPIETS